MINTTFLALLPVCMHGFIIERRKRGEKSLSFTKPWKPPQWCVSRWLSDRPVAEAAGIRTAELVLRRSAKRRKKINMLREARGCNAKQNQHHKSLGPLKINTRWDVNLRAQSSSFPLGLPRLQLSSDFCPTSLCLFFDTREVQTETKQTQRDLLSLHFCLSCFGNPSLGGH